MVAFAYRCCVVTCIWFGFNSIIVFHTHLYELMFEFADTPIVKDNKLRSRVTCQPGVMDVADLFVASTISNQPVLIAGSIIVSSSREYIFACFLIVNGPTISTLTMTQGSDSAILGGSSPYFLRVCLFFVI
jgi:hypothetical protein